jgi:hypothetical protein
MTLLMLALGLFGLTQVSAALPGLAANRVLPDSCASGNSSATTVHAAQHGAPFLNLCDGHALGGTLAGLRQAQPLALASGDFDEDGTPDLVSGFAVGNGGTITLHRGNVNALWPYGAALRNGPPPAFLPNPRSFSVPEAPNFIATGDFDADGHWDVVTAQLGSNALYLLKGDGHGGFAAPQRIPLTGSVTAMIAGEINRADGLTDLVVAVNSASGPQALVFESARGALKDQPEVFLLPKPATALALGRFDGGAMNDLAVAAGSQIVLIHARDRKTSLDATQRATVALAKVTVQNFPFAIKALVAGDFTGTGPTVAALGDDGSVHVLEHTVSLTSPDSKALLDPNFQPTFQTAKPGPDGKPAIVGGRITPALLARQAALRQALQVGANAPEWAERSAVALPAGFAQASPLLVAANLTGSGRDDIVAPDSGNSKLHVLSTHSASEPSRASMLKAVLANLNTATIPPASMQLLDSLDAVSAPAAVLPMRLNRMGLSGLVTLHTGQVSPTVMTQTFPASNIFTVTNTSDAVMSGGPGQYTGPDGSLRAAIYNANNATGPALIQFDIPTTDPGYNPATGIWKIQPLSTGTQAELLGFALDYIGNTVTIDGYTQPGASPNTSTTTDNAVILIQIDGGAATTPGNDGLEPFDDSGTVIRGLAFSGWTNAYASGGGSSGACGIEAYGSGDFFEGNFSGTDATGKNAAPNRIGIFADGGIRNIIGGTTPQARNLLSGNNLAGVLVLTGTVETTVQGNFIGTDITGAVALSNLTDGVGTNGSQVSFGGAIPGAGNLISGNPNNVDLNDLTDENGASNSLVQGNLIGTDGTGTKRQTFGGTGVSILNNPQYMTIGGTTPAARNVISGNVTGIYVFDNAFNNTIQGNYIGTDITGTVALPNLTYGYESGSVVETTDGVAGTVVPAGLTNLGGAVPGAGNVISGNLSDGINISGTSQYPAGYGYLVGNTIQGNLIGTDYTGTQRIPNQGNGIYLLSGATNNLIGGTAPGAGNLIAYNKQNGVLIDPGTGAAGPGTGNQTIANTILSNTGSGVRINSGSQDRISKNAIFGNGALGINLDGLGPNLNTNCNATTTGPNNQENAPVLTAGSGAAFISATATDPSGNTSQFSNSVPESLSGNVLDVLGTFNGLASTAYTIEFFSSPSADASGYGQGQTYIGSTVVTTDGSCAAPVSDPVNLTQADVSVKLVGNYFGLQAGADFGQETYTGTVTNIGPATAHNVVFTDVLPAGLSVSSASCNLGACQSPITTSFGSCTVSGSTVTCNVGTLPPGTATSVTIPVTVAANASGSITNTATVSATEVDPVLANNTSSVTETVTFQSPLIDRISPTSALVNSPDVVVTIYGFWILPNSAVTFNGNPVNTVAFLDNQGCAWQQTEYCPAIQVLVPASMLTTAGTPTISVINPSPAPYGYSPSASTATFTIAASCTYTFPYSSLAILPATIPSGGTDWTDDSVEVGASASTCPWTATSSVPWAVVLNNASATGNQTVDIAIGPNADPVNPRTGSVTIAGQTFDIQQDPGASCGYQLSPTSASFTTAGGTGTIQVTSTCFSYSAASYAPWITIPQSAYFFSDNGAVTYSVAPNTGGPLSGYLVVGTQPFPVTQAAPSCYYTLSATSTLLPIGGGTGSVSVTPSSPTCAWKATTGSSSPITITSGASGTGNGTVNFSVAANTGGALTSNITIGDQSGGSSIYAVNQPSAFSCTFTISPSTVNISANGAANSFTVTPSYQTCQWNAASSDSTVLTLPNSSSGTGSGSVYYVVGQNTGAPRTLTITAGCQIFTINQDGTQASNPVPAITTLLPTGTTAGSGAFTLTVNGSGFINGSTVNFNSNARSTTYISANQLTAAILATDVASAGTPAITVTNPSPGGGTSNAVTFSVKAALITPTVSVSPSPASITSAQPLTVTIGVSGNPTPTGSVTLTSGSYTSAATALTSGGATINIPAGSLATGTDTLSVSYTPDTSSSSIYTTATGSNTVIVTTPAKITPTLTVSLSPASITTTQALTVTVGVSGGSGNPTPTGSVTLISGSYSSAATTLSSGSATINIPAGSLGTGTDTLSVSYTPDSNGSSTYNSATGSNTVIVTTPAKITPTLTVSSSPASITTTQALTVTVGVSGGSGNPNPTGSVTLTSGSYSSAATTLSSGGATINIPAGSLATGTDTLSVSYTPDSTSSTTYNSATGSNTVSVIAATEQVSVGTTPAGLSFTVDGTTYTSTQTLTWNIGSTHTIASTSPQVSTGTQNSFSSWSDAGALSHTVTASSSVTSYTASFSTAYLLTPSASPLAGGGVTPTVATYYPAGTAVNIAATPNSGYTFSSWTGNVASSSSASTTVTMNAPQSVTANFAVVSTATVTLTPSALAFPNTTVGVTSAPLAITVNNTGNATLTISGISIAGNNPTDFAITTGANACGSSLAAGASCSVYITFTPASAAGFAATLSITDNASAGQTVSVTSRRPIAEGTSSSSTQTAPLTGTGTAAAAPIASLTAPAAFPNTTVATTSAALTATLSNTGNAALAISGITLAGTNPTDFAIVTGSNACNTTLAAGASCSIYVTFTPASAANFSATLTVADNAAGSPQTAALTGTGTAVVVPTYTVASPTPAQTVQPGGAATYTINVTPVNGSFTSLVTLSASGLPTGATATFAPASVTPGSAGATSQLTIQTAAAASAEPAKASPWPLAAPALGLIGLFFVPGKRRRRWITLGVLLITSLGAITALSGCGGGFGLGNVTPPPSSYTITVTGTSGSSVQTTTVQLTVQ